MITENLSTLKIHKLTQAQYDRELAAGNIDENALYLTPDEEIDLSGYATVEQLDEVAGVASGVRAQVSTLSADVASFNDELGVVESLATTAKNDAANAYDRADEAYYYAESREKPGAAVELINRGTMLHCADTNYTTLMARGEKLLDATTFDAVTDWSTHLVNGAIAWRYE